MSQDLNISMQQFNGTDYDILYPLTNLDNTVGSPKEIGFNIWDEQWEVGGINNNDGKNVGSASNIRTKNYNGINDNCKYYIVFNSSANMYLHFYDKNKQWIKLEIIETNTIVTPPLNSAYIRFRMESTYGTAYLNDICINISNPLKNGTYEPFLGGGLRQDIWLNSNYGVGNAIINGGWNQQVKNGNFSEGTTGWTAASGTIQSTSSGLKITVDAEGKAYVRPVSFANPYIPPEQKAFVSIKFSTINLTSGNLKLAKVTSSGNSADRTIAQTDFEGIEKYSVAWSTGIYINDASAGDYVVVKSINTMLLPEIFGAGNEPSIQQFKQLFPDDYYPYTQGVLGGLSYTIV